MSDTPRTDAAIAAIPVYTAHPSSYVTHFARELERENARLREALESVLRDADHEISANGQLFTDVEPIRALLARINRESYPAATPLPQTPPAAPCRTPG